MKTITPMETDTMSRLYLELSQVVGGVAKTRKEIVLSYALLQCAMYFRDSDPPLWLIYYPVYVSGCGRGGSKIGAIR